MPEMAKIRDSVFIPEARSVDDVSWCMGRAGRRLPGDERSMQRLLAVTQWLRVAIEILRNHSEAVLMRFSLVIGQGMRAHGVSHAA